MKYIITIVIILLFFSCERKSNNSKLKKTDKNIVEFSSYSKISSSQNDTIIQKILYNKNILNHISFAYKYGVNHILVDTKIDFNLKSIKIDSMIFTLSKNLKTNKDIIIEIDSLSPTFYKFISYYRNGNSYYIGFIKKDSIWKAVVESYEEVDNIDKNVYQVDIKNHD